MLATVAVVAGGLLAWLAAVAAGYGRAGVAAGLGALGAVAAGAVAAIGVSLLKRFSSPTPQEVLVDVASPLHPLMKRLVTEAPGTYAHSIAVANLAEAGAEAIGADGLVARVGAYYHDIGKLTQPGLFFENQDEDANPHAGSTPARSADLIMAHVTDGLALAEQYGLPDSVTAIIKEHHGTSLVRYFYHQASESQVAFFESDFRYPGQRPRTPEAALVMLADGSEASVRALPHAEGLEVECAIRSVIDERLADGQLNQSGLGAEELERVVRVFVKRLVSIKHARCPYPHPARGLTPGGPTHAD